ncbi:hypothetical protein HMPREF0290_0247 [Corynebacterium efficiens YS-314]|nr:hypothetical protein [Corynebacterium efficiens]EEW51167.1 hypothetical protein HMPREF0290_0247 [Corynebacterium efficiens YS-314]
MFMTTDFPERLAATTRDLLFPPLTPAGGASRTESALRAADAGWRALLYDAEDTLASSLHSMETLARSFCEVDDTLAGDLGRHL